MAIINKIPTRINKEQILIFLPFAAFIFIVIIFFFFIFLPLSRKLSYLNNEIRNKKSVLIYIEKGGEDLNKLAQEIKELAAKINAYDKKLPKAEQANVLIDTLKDITAESYLRFSSIEPQPSKKFSLTKQKDVYLELPIKVRLKCGYYDLIDFIAKIESAGRLMKITDLEIKESPGDMWEHDVLLLISAFARITEKEAHSG